MQRRAFLNVLLQLCLDVGRHDRLPGYAVLSTGDRIRVDLAAAAMVTRSWLPVHLLATLVIWLLVGYSLVWHFDMPGVWVHLPPASATVWCLPWLAHARRTALRALLGLHWAAL